MIKYTRCTSGNQKIHGVRDWSKGFLASPKTPGDMVVFRARENKKVLGQVVVTGDNWIVFLAVNPKYRGKGIGTKLLHKAEAEIFGRGEETVHLHPQKEFQDRLIPWYESEGYEIIGFDSKVEEYHMVKHNPEIYKQHPLDESRDYKYKAQVGDFWLQKDSYSKEWSVCDDKDEADEFESETEPRQIINQMKRDGKVKKDTKIKIHKMKED